MRSCSLVIVNYRTAALVRDAVASARAASSVPIEVVIVDNSESADELSELHLAGADLIIESPRNLGYGAGVNLGAARASGEVLIASNPDVFFHGDAIDELTVELRENSVAGPALFWDRARTWRLPPADLPSVRQKAGQLRASRSRAFARRRDIARIRERVRFWSLERTAPAEAVSGAVMAMPRRLFDRVGGFDERFFLYFEEMDLIRRIRRDGGQVSYVPKAACTHFYSQSARSNAAAGGFFVRSETAYLRKWGGEALVRFLQKHGRPLPDLTEFVSIGRGETLVLEGAPPEELVVEASSLSSFETGAGTFPIARELKVPAEILDGYTAAVLYLRAIEKDTGVVLGAWSMTM